MRLPSRFTVDHLRQLLTDRAIPAGTATGPVRAGGPIEVDRLITGSGLLALPAVNTRSATTSPDAGSPSASPQRLAPARHRPQLLRSLPTPPPPLDGTACSTPAPPDDHPQSPAKPTRPPARQQPRQHPVACQRIHPGITHAAARRNARTPPTTRWNPEHVKPSQPITVQIYCRLTVTVHDPQAVTTLAVQQLGDAEIDWSAEKDDLETAAEELSGDLLNSLASLAEPDRMLAGIPGVSAGGGRIWAEQGNSHPRFQPGFQDPD
jgi:hypothetical protein